MLMNIRNTPEVLIFGVFFGENLSPIYYTPFAEGENRILKDQSPLAVGDEVT